MKPIVDPEITKVTITPVAELQGTVEPNTKVADLSAEGGTAPYTYSLKEENDYADFQIVGTTVQAKSQLTGKVTKKITVTATDSKQKTKDATAQIEVKAEAV